MSAWAGARLKVQAKPKLDQIQQPDATRMRGQFMLIGGLGVAL
jgi:hypothetical protein